VPEDNALFELVTHVDILAPADRVWSILTDFAAYPSWNPFIKRIEGPLALGERLEAVLQAGDAKPMTFRPHVVRLEPGRAFAWLGRLGLPWIFDGEHRFELAPTAGGTRLTHAERFSGLLVPFFRGTLDGKTRAAFEAMNAALKARAEAG
jgi:hypothetical protein